MQTFCFLLKCPYVFACDDGDDKSYNRSHVRDALRLLADGLGAEVYHHCDADQSSWGLPGAYMHTTMHAASNSVSCIAMWHMYVQLVVA